MNIINNYRKLFIFYLVFSSFFFFFLLLLLFLEPCREESIYIYIINNFQRKFTYIRFVRMCVFLYVFFSFRIEMTLYVQVYLYTYIIYIRSDFQNEKVRKKKKSLGAL